MIQMAFSSQLKWEGLNPILITFTDPLRHDFWYKGYIDKKQTNSKYLYLEWFIVSWKEMQISRHELDRNIDVLTWTSARHEVCPCVLCREVAEDNC